MDTTTSATRRGIAIGLTLALLAAALWSVTENRADAAATELPTVQAQSTAELGSDLSVLAGGWYAKYDGIDGESLDANHKKWTDVLGYYWGMNRSGARPGAAKSSSKLDPLVLTFEYESMAPHMLKRCYSGAVTPTLEFELTTTHTDAGRVTYLRYEMTNVTCKAYDVGGSADGSPPRVEIANFFEKVKVTYTEFDDKGGVKRTHTTTIKVTG
ncbi:MAG: type VI secretion system tube protein Hcp [bacterium]|nr:type VI secretion system tube protein Hcp [bacterium]